MSRNLTPPFAAAVRRRNDRREWTPRHAAGLATALLTLPFLASCGSLLDPAPYQPYPAASPTASKPMQTLSPDACPVISSPPAPKGLIQFVDFGDASAKLCRLGAGYAVARNNLMRERLAFDIPAMGLGLAGAANGAFNGAKDLTLALGIGSAGMAGSTLYFSPSTRINAYNAASQSLLCASTVSLQMAGEQTRDQVDAVKVLGDSNTNIAIATSFIEAGAHGSVSQSDIKDLVTARDAAVKALSALATADQLIVAGPGRLEGFANQVITGATNKIVSGTQNIDAVLALIKAQSGGGASPKPTLNPAALAMPTRNGAATPSGPTAATVIANLNQETQQANDFVSRIDDAWSNFSKCSGS